MLRLLRHVPVRGLQLLWRSCCMCEAFLAHHAQLVSAQKKRG